MNTIIIGKRIPIGAATTGLIMFFGELWNATHPDLSLAMSAWGGLAAAVTAIVQICVVNLWGVTTGASEPKE
jgi:hypothetical protein